MRHPLPSLLEVSLVLTLMSAAPAAAADADARFSAPVIVGTGDEPTALVAADLNGDAKPDLATADWGSDSVSVLLGRGDGSFAKRARYRTSDGPSGLTSADVNADGKPDLVTASEDGTLVVLLNDGAGRFRRLTSLRPAGDEVVAGDVNGDGVVDLVTSAYARRDFAVLLGIGDGRFHGAQIYKARSEGAKEVALGDLNADGHPDAVLVLADDRLAVRLGAGDGTFGPEQGAPATDEGENMLDVTLADLNHDGRLDAATASFYGDVGVFLGRGDGTFAARKSYSTIGKADSVTVADYDSDGTLDLAISAYDYVPFVRRGRGDGTFGKARYLEWVLADHGETADFNQDGRPDLAFVLSEQTYAKVFLNWTGLPAPPCVVLDLSGYRLRKAKQYLGFSGCRLGHVTRRYSRRVRRNHVISVALPEGTVLPSGSAIDMVLSRGRRGSH